MFAKKLVVASILASATFCSIASANDAGVNTAVGAVVGALIGNSVNGHNGAVVGGVLGAVVGASTSNYGSGYYDRGGYQSRGYYSGYAQPAPVYYQPAPVYYQPEPVYYQPAQSYYPASTVYYQSSGRGYGDAPRYNNRQRGDYARGGPDRDHRRDNDSNWRGGVRSVNYGR